MNFKDPEKSDLKNFLLIAFFVAAIMISVAYFGVRAS